MKITTTMTAHDNASFRSKAKPRNVNRESRIDGKGRVDIEVATDPVARQAGRINRCQNGFFRPGRIILK